MSPPSSKRYYPSAWLSSCRALAASRLVGRLQLTVVPWDDRDREVHLLAKTHAGTATERATWRQALM
jgi:hypothetical protein